MSQQMLATHLDPNNDLASRCPETIANVVQPHIQFLISRNIKLVALSAQDSSPEALESFQSAFADRYRTLAWESPFSVRKASGTVW